jgi:hypothetical protein
MYFNQVVSKRECTIQLIFVKASKELLGILNTYEDIFMIMWRIMQAFQTTVGARFFGTGSPKFTLLSLSTLKALNLAEVYAFARISLVVWSTLGVGTPSQRRPCSSLVIYGAV